MARATVFFTKLNLQKQNYNQEENEYSRRRRRKFKLKKESKSGYRRNKRHELATNDKLNEKLRNPRVKPKEKVAAAK